MSTSPHALRDCPECGGPVARMEGSLDAHVGRRTVAVPAQYDRCSECGEIYLAPGQMNEVLKRASDLIRLEEGLLSSDEIKVIRRQLGVTQTQLEQLIGAGPKTVVRWEKGTVFQNGATDTLLRVLRDVPEAASYLLRERGVERNVIPLIPAARRVSYRYPVTRGDAAPPLPPIGVAENHGGHREDAVRPIERAEGVA